jgi:hypothetical protein
MDAPSIEARTMKAQSFSDFLKANKSFSKLTSEDGDELYNRLLVHVRSFGLTPKRDEIDGIQVSMLVAGLNPRFWSIDRIEDELSSWRPTIFVQVPGSNPVFRFKFRDRFESERAYAALVESMKSGCITSMGDLYRTVQDATYYPEGASRIISCDPVGLDKHDLDALNKAMDKVLQAPKKAQGLSMVDRIASMIPSLSFQVDGSTRSLSLLRRAMRAIRHGRHSALLQSRLESFSGQRMESWIDAIGSMLEVAA